MAWRMRDTNGAEAIEMAIVLPALLMFFLGIVDCGRLLWSNATLAHAVEAASRCAVVNTATCGTNANIEAYAVTQAWSLGLAPSAFTVTTPACGTQVNGTMTFKFVIPWFYGTSPFGAGNSMTLTATACYPT
jgi:Flp pilus assembly protein TadG